MQESCDALRKGIFNTSFSLRGQLPFCLGVVHVGSRRPQSPGGQLPRAWSAAAAPIRQCAMILVCSDAYAVAKLELLWNHPKLGPSAKRPSGLQKRVEVTWCSSGLQNAQAQVLRSYSLHLRRVRQQLLLPLRLYRSLRLEGDRAPNLSAHAQIARAVLASESA